MSHHLTDKRIIRDGVDHSQIAFVNDLIVIHSLFSMLGGTAKMVICNDDLVSGKTKHFFYCICNIFFCWYLLFLVFLVLAHAEI